jgi:hypothetical protein
MALDGKKSGQAALNRLETRESHAGKIGGHGSMISPATPVRSQDSFARGSLGFSSLEDEVRERTCMPNLLHHSECQTEPPEWPTETNERISPNRPSHGQSLVGDRKTLTANTPRNRGLFRSRRQVLARVRHTQSLGGGGGSRGRTRLWGRFPDRQGKYRQFLVNWVLPTELAPRFLSVYKGLAIDSQHPQTGNQSGQTGNSFRGAGKSWRAMSASKLPSSSRSIHGPSQGESRASDQSQRFQL